MIYSGSILDSKQKIKYHLFFWSAYFLFEINAEFAYLHGVYKQFSWQKVFVFSLIAEYTFLFAEIPAFYIILDIVNGKIGFLKSNFRKIGAVILVLTFFTIAYRIFSHDLIYPIYFGFPEDTPRFSEFGILNAMMNVVFAVSVAFGFEKFIEQSESQKKLAELSKEKSDTELKFLKNQISPHFLFNTLNNIYGLSLKKDDETPEIILKLSKIMRYNIYDSANSKVTIEKEIENLNDFIDIQKIRYKNLKISFDFKMDNANQEISPLILLHFVENAFKHGASESLSQSYINIALSLNNKVLLFAVENSKEMLNEKFSTKIGFKNIKRQLEILYPKHFMEIMDEKNRYKIFLKIDFKDEQ